MGANWSRLPSPNLVPSVVSPDLTMVPPEILLTILVKLDNKAVLECRLVCSLWRALIDQSVSLPLELTEENCMEIFPKANSNNTSTFLIKRFHSLTIRWQSMDNLPRNLSESPFNPTHLKNLRFSVHHIQPEYFKKILEGFSSLETLAIDFVRARGRYRNWPTLDLILHQRIKTLTFYKVLVRQNHQTVQILNSVNFPNLKNLSILGDIEVEFDPEDMSHLRNAVLPFVHRHRESLQEINAFIQDDEYNRSEIQNELETIPGNEKLYSVRILNTCATQWRNLLEDLITISRLEITLSNSQNWNSAVDLVGIGRRTLTSVDIYCDSMGAIDLEFFRDFPNLKILCLKCFTRCGVENILALPGGLEDLHLCLFPLTGKNWDDLLDSPQLKNLSGLEVGIYQDPHSIVAFKKKHYEKACTHSGLREMFIHGKSYARRWKFFEETRKFLITPEFVATISENSVHLKFQEEVEDAEMS